MKQFIDKKIFNMGKLKEYYLNNLTPDEMDERYGVSAFEYVELMENYKNLFDDSGNPMPDDVAEQIANEIEKSETEYYEQSAIDEINDSVRLKYSDSDVIQAIKSVKNEHWFVDRILKELNGIWNAKNGVE